MPTRAIAIVVVCCAALAALGVTLASPWEDAEGRSVVVTDDGGEALATVPLEGDTFAVSYRNSIYRTLAEERYEVRADGSYHLVQIAAEQLAVLEEYYGVPGAPSKAPENDRRRWVVPPDPAHPAVFTDLSIAATDRGERVLHVPGSEPVALWRLVEDSDPYLSIDIKENP
ncbi:hypothetical protein O9K63_03405 [Janibacter cremeus]|uniref:hypothetical protein n=1 Tax=Janibacter cremeus TaxID=1285192 RepID=UPI0023F915C4|nr:hypothetical protein [Janibacter cremeus]WEV78856.1 hypothetical protein O9K63_03405 [Janibacter cremeus]